MPPDIPIDVYVGDYQYQKIPGGLESVLLYLRPIRRRLDLLDFGFVTKGDRSALVSTFEQDGVSARLRKYSNGIVPSTVNAIYGLLAQPAEEELRASHRGVVFKVSVAYTYGDEPTTKVTRTSLRFPDGTPFTIDPQPTSITDIERLVNALFPKYSW